MIEVISFLVVLALILFFLPVGKETKIRRIKAEGYTNLAFTVGKNNWYRTKFLADKNSAIRSRYKSFICFGYTDIREI